MLGTVVWTTVGPSLATRCLAATTTSTGCAQEKTWPLSLKSYPQDYVHSYCCRSCGKPVPPERPGLWKNGMPEALKVPPFSTGQTTLRSHLLAHLTPRRQVRGHL